MSEKKVKVGIATYEQQKRRMLAIARGEYKPSPDEPKIWFSSIESLAQLLNSKNQELLRVIEESKPSSLHELAKLTHRKVSNLSRTMKSLDGFGIVRLEKNGNRLQPKVQFNRFIVDLGSHNSWGKSAVLENEHPTT